MGHLREKYTNEYFTGKNEQGWDVGYGATLAYDENGELILREHDRRILNQVRFKNKNILALGVGRGEELFYAVANGAENCIGVDFSESAIKIAQEIINRKKINSIKLETSDALKFLNKYVKLENLTKFDVVLMFDFVEHVPRAELREIFQKLKFILAEKSILVINTPAYKFDNDVLVNGLDERNLINCLDTSDICEATAGMHCNKYTIASLQSFMNEFGFANITEMHFFIDNAGISNFSNISYLDRWRLLLERGYPIKNEYVDDIIEYPYSDAPALSWRKFVQGDLCDLSLYTTDIYESIAYRDGKIDSEVFSDAIFSKPSMGLVVFDVGAHVGADGMVFAKKIGESGRVISFEPNIYNRNRLFINLSHNQSLSGRVSVFPYALSDISGKIMMNISPNIDEGHSSTSRISGAHSKISDSSLPEGFFNSEVEVIRLDEFVKNTGIIPDIIKVDVEGAEQLMLNGSIETLKKHHPVVFMEIHSEYCAIACYRIFSSLNYIVAIIHEEDDNRLMIKAIFDGPNESTINNRLLVEAQTNLSFYREKIKELDLTVKERTIENHNLAKENMDLSEKNNLLEKEIKALRKMGNESI